MAPGSTPPLAGLRALVPPRATLAGLTVAFLCACSAPTQPFAAGPDDAGADGGASAECVASAAGAVPHFAIGLGDGLDLDSTALALPDGRVLVVFERYDAAFTTGRLWASVLSAEELTPTAPSSLSLGTEAFVSAPALVSVHGVPYLYFTVDSALHARPGLARAPLDGTTVGARETVPRIAGVDWLLSWPRFVGLPDGSVAVAFHDGRGRPTYAQSADGVQFGAPSVVDPDSRAMANVHAFADGTLAFTSQNGADPMVSAVRLGTAGAAPTWSAPITVSALSNVHDTTAVRRLDGGLDLYYISTEGAAGFRLHRRALFADGRLGAEEQVTFDAEGEVSKPQVLRLPDCRLLVTYAEITQRDVSLAPVRQRLGALVLVGDAPE